MAGAYEYARLAWSCRRPRAGLSGRVQRGHQGGQLPTRAAHQAPIWSGQRGHQGAVSTLRNGARVGMHQGGGSISGRVPRLSGRVPPGQASFHLGSARYVTGRAIGIGTRSPSSITVVSARGITSGVQGRAAKLTGRSTPTPGRRQHVSRRRVSAKGITRDVPPGRASGGVQGGPGFHQNCRGAVGFHQVEVNDGRRGFG